MFETVFTAPQRSCGKVMFSQASVILFMGGGMHGRRVCVVGACMAGGMHGGGGHAWQRGVHGRGHCMAGAGCAWQGHAWQGHAWQGVCVAGGTATAVGGTHPTGMHSCLKEIGSFSHLLKV